MENGQRKGSRALRSLRANAREWVRVGDALNLPEQVSVDDAVQVVGIGDLAAQLRRAYANIAELLDRFALRWAPSSTRPCS